MDNRLLNVNGRTKTQLLLALQFAFKDGWDKDQKAVGWSVSDEHGLLLHYIHSNTENYTKFLSPHSPVQCANLIWEWVHSEESNNVKLSEWCDKIDMDGSLVKGWQLYLGDWGKVGKQDFILCAAKPAYCWLGK